MEDKVKAFLASGILEEYIYGSLGKKDQEEVSRYMAKYPDVRKEYNVLQEQLEKVSRQQAIKAPVGMKSQILESIPSKVQPSPTATSPWIKYLALLGIITSLLLAWSWNDKNAQLKEEKLNYAQLAEECEQRENRIEAQRQKIAFLNSEQTQRYELKGNQLAPDFNAMVFVNEAFGKAIVSPTQKFTLPNKKCLQLWGDLDGKMIPVAVFNQIIISDFDLDINPNFTSLNLTIEEKTADGKGHDHPDVSQLIASIAI